MKTATIVILAITALFSSLAFSLTPKNVPFSAALTVTSAIVIRVTEDPATGAARYFWFKGRFLAEGSTTPRILCMKLDLNQSTNQPIIDDTNLLMYIGNNQSTNVMTTEDAVWCTQ